MLPSKQSHEQWHEVLPPPTESIQGAIGWRFTKRHTEAQTWEPTGWEIVFPDHVLTLDLNGMGVRDSTLHPVRDGLMRFMVNPDSKPRFAAVNRDTGEWIGVADTIQGADAIGKIASTGGVFVSVGDIHCFPNRPEGI